MTEMDSGTAGDGQLEPCVESPGCCGDESGNVKSAKRGNRPVYDPGQLLFSISHYENRQTMAIPSLAIRRMLVQFRE
jgi:hypothetical protein